MHAPAKDIARADRTPTVAIVGGGVSGAAVAIHLDRAFPNAVRLVVFEPRTDIGRGLAYSTRDPVHKINVPALRMELFADDPEHFDRWFAGSGLRLAKPSANAFDPAHFSTRLAFGDYVNRQVEAIKDLKHIRAKAIAVERIGSKFKINSQDGQVIRADVLVIATGHSSPSLPAPFVRAASQSPRIIRDPWRPNVLSNIEPDDRILIVGTGLTMADLIASLEEYGHRGEIIAVSRRGQRSKSHALETLDPFGDFISTPIQNALQLLAQIRATVAEAASKGISWHAVLDQVRYQAQNIWLNLPPSEKHKVLRHLRPFWDTHRFRLAPQVSDALEQMLARSQLKVKASSIENVAIEDNHISVSLRERRTNRLSSQTFDRVLIATGANYRDLFRADPLLNGLQKNGLAKPDRYGLGIHVDNLSRAIDSYDHPQDHIYVAGPAARGTFGELMGVTELSKQALQIAWKIGAVLQLSHQAAFGPES